MSRCELATIDQLLTCAAAELFGSLGVPCDPVAGDGQPPPGPLVASTVGFCGDGLRGAITLLLERPTISALYADVAPSGGESMRDACGELANMLLGGLQAQLRPFGAAIRIGLPITISGAELELGASCAATSTGRAFATGHGQILVRLDLELDHGFAFASAPALEPSVEAGDALYF